MHNKRVNPAAGEPLGMTEVHWAGEKGCGVLRRQNCAVHRAKRSSQLSMHGLDPACLTLPVQLGQSMVVHAEARLCVLSAYPACAQSAVHGYGGVPAEEPMFCSKSGRDAGAGMRNVGTTAACVALLSGLVCRWCMLKPMLCSTRTRHMSQAR